MEKEISNISMPSSNLKMQYEGMEGSSASSSPEQPHVSRDGIGRPGGIKMLTFSVEMPHYARIQLKQICHALLVCGIEPRGLS